jgi:hypothetical protein
MMDKTEHQIECLNLALKNVSEICLEIGFDKRLGELTEKEIRTIVESAVDGYVNNFRTDSLDMEIPF